MTVVPGEFDTVEGTQQPTVEHECKLTVPRHETEALWQFLLTNFSQTGKLLKKHCGPEASARIAEVRFTDRYYDNDDMHLLKSSQGLRHRVWQEEPDEAGQTSPAREIVQVKWKDPQGEALNRLEMKFPVQPVERERRAGIADIIHQDNAHAFHTLLAQLRIHPSALRNHLTLHQRRRRVYIDRDGLPLLSLTLDEVRSQFWWQAIRLTELEIELDEARYTQANAQERKALEALVQEIRNSVLAAFPGARQDQTSKYRKVYQAFRQRYVDFDRAIRFGVPLEALVAGGGALLWFGGLWLGRRGK